MARVKIGPGLYITTPDGVSEEQFRTDAASVSAKEDAAFRSWAQMAGQDPDKLSNPTYARDQWRKSSAYQDFARGVQGAISGTSGVEPGAPGTLAPDLTDEALKKVRRAMAASLMVKQGRSSSFLTGPGGTMSMVGSAPMSRAMGGRGSLGGGVNYTRLGMRGFGG